MGHDDAADGPGPQGSTKRWVLDSRGIGSFNTFKLVDVKGGDHPWSCVTRHHWEWLHFPRRRMEMFSKGHKSGSERVATIRRARGLGNWCLVLTGLGAFATDRRFKIVLLPYGKERKRDEVTIIMQTQKRDFWKAAFSFGVHLYHFEMNIGKGGTPQKFEWREQNAFRGDAHEELYATQDVHHPVVSSGGKKKHLDRMDALRKTTGWVLVQIHGHPPPGPINNIVGWTDDKAEIVATFCQPVSWIPFKDALRRDKMVFQWWGSAVHGDLAASPDFVHVAALTACGIWDDEQRRLAAKNKGKES
ncbi:hypothetical protein B0T24DRAFT_684132 [Lasiosphaeria ovina]|uniref:Uncharacterized protein n=1 Tax=Lasiosphaeria ovina TaxID=92902 RepID=A0AAE0JUT6_9PEZI|nr:hypothetical protein B0T24DRAFT_684132 [Lasiosphaeria ovina]